MKLMTLKDIIVKIPITIPVEDYERAAQRLENECNFALKLKQEAIKWIKELQAKINQDGEIESTMLEGDEFPNPEIHRDRDLNTCCNRNRINWIKHFFNITEEEIK